MLDYEELKALREIAARTARADPRFASSLRQGQPSAPREYRRSARVLLIVGVALCLAGVATGYGSAAVVFPLVAVLTGSAWFRRQRDRPPQRG